MKATPSVVSDVMQRVHQVSLDQDESGWRWACSCGQGSKAPARARGYVAAASERHLVTAERLVRARLEAPRP